MTRRLPHPAATLAGLFAAYAAFVFPFAYFRHDDWLNVNSTLVGLSRGWSFLWSVAWIEGGEERVWFFRPLMKLSLYALFKAYGYAYYAWLATLFAAGAAGIWFTGRAIALLTGSIEAGRLFVLLMAVSVHLHFGTFTWVSEAAVNCPQILLLGLQLFLFADGLLARDALGRRVRLAGAAVAYLLALGFKESSIFQVLLLGALLLHAPRVAALPLRVRAAVLVPYVAVTAAFLAARLGWMPYHPAFVPEWTLRNLRPLALLPFAFGLPVVARLAAAPADERRAAAGRPWSLATYAAIVAATLTPYLGHPFFGPGWLLNPGFYTVAFVCLACPPAGGARSAARTHVAAALLLAASLATTAFFTVRLGWWQWGPALKRLHAQIATVDPAGVDRIVVRDCIDPRHPGATVWRLLAHPYALQAMWELTHGRRPSVAFIRCDVPPPAGDGRTLLLRWYYPSFTLSTGARP